MEVIGHCRSSSELGHPYSTRGYNDVMSVIQIEGMEGLRYCSAIGGNVIATETENVSRLLYGWGTGFLLQWVAVWLWIQ